ncbi:hypothetical protein P691DRAFT_799443 [Macrolepiota fuliginosa MF-IS2]|uniref:Chromo domain-containing protein n=1 Tax=Macrolepiota fuliginosa MF-IS2 TaxID=1400762 RepID=A0A9P5X1B0_9AGAR|nr:hypothetical protein P691DRAFT_799443 [Macrolepiota fuliginosa MF-IS2]
MPRQRNPYVIRSMDKNHSTVTLEIPKRGNPKALETFHTSLIRPWVEDSHDHFPKPHRPELNTEGEAVGKGYSYLVKWDGFPEEENKWLPGRMVTDCEALDAFFLNRGLNEKGNRVVK